MLTSFAYMYIKTWRHYQWRHVVHHATGYAWNKSQGKLYIYVYQNVTPLWRHVVHHATGYSWTKSQGELGISLDSNLEPMLSWTDLIWPRLHNYGKSPGSLLTHRKRWIKRFSLGQENTPDDRGRPVTVSDERTILMVGKQLKKIHILLCAN